MTPTFPVRPSLYATAARRHPLSSSRRHHGHPAALTSAGGVLIVGISIKLLGLADVKVGNFLPALVCAPALYGLVSAF